MLARKWPHYKTVALQLTFEPKIQQLFGDFNKHFSHHFDINASYYTFLLGLPIHISLHNSTKSLKIFSSFYVVTCIESSHLLRPIMRLLPPLPSQSHQRDSLSADFFVGQPMSLSLPAHFFMKNLHLFLRVPTVHSVHVWIHHKLICYKLQVLRQLTVLLLELHEWSPKAGNESAHVLLLLFRLLDLAVVLSFLLGFFDAVVMIGIWYKEERDY